MKFIAENKFYILFAILRFCIVFIFVLFLQNWTIDFDNVVYGTRDITYYYGNIEFLLGQSDTYYPHYSVGASLIGIPIYFFAKEITRFIWISSFVMCFFSSISVFLVGEIAEQWYTKSVGILSSFFWFMFPFLEFFIFQKIKTKMFLFLTGFAGILPDSVSLFFDLLTVYYLTLILLNQEDKENKKKWYMGCGLSLGLALTMRITNIALLLVVLFGLCFLRRRTLKDKSNHLKNNKNSQKEISQIWQKLSGKIQSISKEKVIYFLVFIGCIFIGLLPELVMKVIAGGSSIEIISGTYQGGIGYYVGFKTRLPWGAVEYFHTGNFRKRFLEGLEINYFFIAFLISPFLVYFNSRHLSKVLPTLIFFAFLAFYSFWSYYPLLNLKYLLPAFPFCFISLSASLVKLFDFLMSYGKSKGKFLNLPLFSRGGKKIDI